jgi:hypothetical protein
MCIFQSDRFPVYHTFALKKHGATLNYSVLLIQTFVWEKYCINISIKPNFLQFLLVLLK